MSKRRGGDDDDDVMVIDSDDDDDNNDAMDNDDDGDEYMEEGEDEDYDNAGETQTGDNNDEEDDDYFYDAEESAMASHASKRSSSSRNADKEHIKTAEDDRIEAQLGHRNTSSSAARIAARLPEIYNRDRTDFDTLEGFNAYQEQIIRYMYEISDGSSKRAAEIQTKIQEDEKFDESDIQQRNRKRKATSEEELLKAKRRYIMEEQKRLEARRNTRIDLVYAVSLPGDSVLPHFTARSVQVQANITAANEATLNPQMATGKRRNIEARAVYVPRAPSNADAVTMEDMLPKVIQDKQQRPMSHTAAVGAGWKTGQLLDICIHEALGGLKIGGFPSSSQGAPGNAIRLPGGSLLRV